MFKQERGITLVALVVTIVVLLILAGVSISLVLGDNGLVTRAKSAQFAEEKAYARDIVETALKAVEVDYLSATGKYTDGTTKPTAADVVEQMGTDVKVNFSADDTGTNKTIKYTPKSTDTSTFYTVTVDLDKFVITGEITRTPAK